MTINIDIQSIEAMRKTFLEAGDAEFTHIETGIINGHKVEVLPEDQRRVNSEFVKNLTKTLFPNDKSEGMMSTKNALMYDAEHLVAQELSAVGPLNGRQIAQALGKAIEIIENAARLRESVALYVKEQLTAKHSAHVDDLPSTEFGALYDVAGKAVDNESDPEKKEAAWKKAVDKMIDKFLRSEKNINSNPNLDSSSKTVLKRLAFDNKEFAETAYFEIAEAAFKTIDTSNMKEVLLNPDEFQDEDRVRVLMNFGSQIGEVFSRVLDNIEMGKRGIEMGTRDLEMVTQLVLTMIASKDPEFATYLTTQTADIQKLHGISENISGQIMKNYRARDGLSETLYANRGLAVLNNMTILSKTYNKASNEIAQSYRNDFKKASGLTEAQCAKLDTGRIEKYLSKGKDKADRARLWKLLLEDVEAGFKKLRESKVLCQSSKDAMIEAILAQPDLYETGALFDAPMSLESELPTQALIDAFSSNVSSLVLLQKIADFSKSMNNALLKLNIQEKIDVDAEGSELSTLMLMHILANRHEGLARFIIDEQNYLNRLNTMLDGLYKDSTKTEEAALYTNAKAFLTAMLSVKRAAGDGLKVKLNGSAPA